MMNKKEILKKVGGILNELNEQYDYLSKSQENLNELELELFSANANFLSDHLSILVKLNENKTKVPITNVDEFEETGRQIVANEAEKQAEKEEPNDIAADWNFELEKEPGLTFEFEEKEADKLFDRPLTDEEKRIIDEKTRLKTETVEEEDEGYIEFEEEIVVAEEEVEIGNLMDLDDINVKEVVISERTFAVPIEALSEEKVTPTVNDILSRNMPHQTVSSQFNTGQSKDLKGMISLNDKLLFVRDLFNGYSLAYSEALELINRFDNFEAADNFLKQNYAQKNDWAKRQDVTDKFYEILNRRFSK